MDYSKILDQIDGNSQKQRQANIAVFLESLTAGLTKDLDNAYAKQTIGKLTYDEFLNKVKSQGYKVYRNSKGKHKLELTEESAAQLLTSMPGM